MAITAPTMGTMDIMDITTDIGAIVIGAVDTIMLTTIGGNACWN
jgi:hypothetical protein